MNIILLQGGTSPERDISLKTSKAIASAISCLNLTVRCLDPADFHDTHDLIKTIQDYVPDLVFIGLHGGEGEDGTIQALLRDTHIPFTGSDHIASALAMDKYRSTMIAKDCSIPTPESKIIMPNYSIQDIQIPFPLIVKPNSAGSSVGTHIVTKHSQLASAIDDALRYDQNVIVQEYIAGRELSVSFLGDDILPPIEIRPLTSFYDYQNKYTKGKTEYICPAPISPSQTQTIQQYTHDICKAIGCKVYGRADFILSSESPDNSDKGDFYFLEVNTLPGMTELSLVPMAANAVGIDFINLIDKIIHLSL